MINVGKNVSKQVSELKAETATKMKPIINLLEYENLAVGANWTAALSQAVTDAVGGALVIPDGNTFEIDQMPILSNIRLTGRGTLKFKNNVTVLAILDFTNSQNVTVTHVTFDGNISGQTTWVEGKKAVRIENGNNITFRHCTFNNLIGDGMYILGTSKNIRILNCDFIGHNQNRNGITIISGQGIDIEGNYFELMARDDMPGAIDLEPNTTTDIIKDVNIRGNRIKGGATAVLQQAIAVQLNDSLSTVQEVNICENLISGAFRYGIALFGQGQPVDISVRNNRIKDLGNVSGGAGIIVSGCVADVQNNTLTNTNDYGVRTTSANEVLITANRIIGAKLYGIDISGDNTKISDNKINDCGTNAAASYGGIHIKGNYNDITFNKIISSATTLTQLGLYVETGTMNTIQGNSFKGMGVRSMTCSVAPQLFGQNAYDGNSGFNSIVGTYPPTSGNFIQGQKIFKPRPTKSGDVSYWECVGAGAPGSWRSVQVGYTEAITAAPSFIGEVAIVSGNVYTAVGVASTADWKQTSN